MPPKMPPSVVSTVPCGHGVAISYGPPLAHEPPTAITARMLRLSHTSATVVPASPTKVAIERTTSSSRAGRRMPDSVGPMSHNEAVRDQFRLQASTFTDTSFAARGLDWILAELAPEATERVLDVAAGAAHL